jgi:hypothetical protein
MMMLGSIVSDRVWTRRAVKTPRILAAPPVCGWQSQERPCGYAGSGVWLKRPCRSAPSCPSQLRSCRPPTAPGRSITLGERGSSRVEAILVALRNQRRVPIDRFLSEP